MAFVVALVAYLSGCATYTPARLPGHLPTQDHRLPPSNMVVVGSTAKATLRSGDKLSGEVTAVSDSSLTIERIGNYGLQERVVLASELVCLEIEDQSGFGSSAVGIVATAVIVLTLGLVAIAATHDPVGEF